MNFVGYEKFIVKAPKSYLNFLKKLLKALINVNHKVLNKYLNIEFLFKFQWQKKIKIQ